MPRLPYSKRPSTSDIRMMMKPMLAVVRMTSAPLAMVGCGHSVTDAALGIQWHVLAMYAPSFITGSLIARLGVERVTGVGLVLVALRDGAPFEVTVFFALAQIPMYMLPALLTPVYRRALAANIGAELAL